MTTQVSTGNGTRYIGTDGCAERYGISGRHWRRMVDAGHAPPPVRFGRLVRWSVQSLAEWEQAGHPRISGRASR
jgi:predicted DNA-binding transcriptional regulator AlpA